MKNSRIKTLGMAEDGKLILGGFFTAHDTFGYHTDWFMSMFLSKFHVSLPYFLCEILQHEDRDPELIWELCEPAYKEARLPFNREELEPKLRGLLALKWEEYQKPSLKELAARYIKESEEFGKMFEGFTE